MKYSVNFPISIFCKFDLHWNSEKMRELNFVQWEQNKRKNKRKIKFNFTHSQGLRWREVTSRWFFEEREKFWLLQWHCSSIEFVLNTREREREKTFEKFFRDNSWNNTTINNQLNGNEIKEHNRQGSICDDDINNKQIAFKKNERDRERMNKEADENWSDWKTGFREVIDQWRWLVQPKVSRKHQLMSGRKMKSELQVLLWWEQNVFGRSPTKGRSKTVTNWLIGVWMEREKREKEDILAKTVYLRTVESFISLDWTMWSESLLISFVKLQKKLIMIENPNFYFVYNPFYEYFWKLCVPFETDCILYVIK